MQFFDLIFTINEILNKGNDVEIRSCKDGYKVVEVLRKSKAVVDKPKQDDTTK